MSDETSKMIAGLMEDNKRLKERVQFLEDLAEENRSEYEHLWKETDSLKSQLRIKEMHIQQCDKDNKEWHRMWTEKTDEGRKLEAELDRLRKAGDAFLGTYLLAYSKGLVTEDVAVKVVDEWVTAKGVQS